MAKSLRSKWKRKMRAIKREKLDEKVLVRLKNMIAQAEAEKSLIPLPTKEELKRKKEAEAEMAEANNSEDKLEENVMEVEGEAPKKKKASLRTMKNADGKYPDWMSVKKIKKFKRIAKMKAKRNTKEAKKARNWRIANSN